MLRQAQHRSFTQIINLLTHERTVQNFAQHRQSKFGKPNNMIPLNN